MVSVCWEHANATQDLLVTIVPHLVSKDGVELLVIFLSATTIATGGVSVRFLDNANAMLDLPGATVNLSSAKTIAPEEVNVLLHQALTQAATLFLPLVAEISWVAHQRAFPKHAVFALTDGLVMTVVRHFVHSVVMFLVVLAQFQESASAQKGIAVNSATRKFAPKSIAFMESWIRQTATVSASLDGPEPTALAPFARQSALSMEPVTRLEVANAKLVGRVRCAQSQFAQNNATSVVFALLLENANALPDGLALIVLFPNVPTTATQEDIAFFLVFVAATIRLPVTIVEFLFAPMTARNTECAQTTTCVIATRAGRELIAHLHNAHMVVNTENALLLIVVNVMRVTADSIALSPPSAHPGAMHEDTAAPTPAHAIAFQAGALPIA